MLEVGKGKTLKYRPSGKTYKKRLMDYDFALAKGAPVRPRPGRLVARLVDYSLRKYPAWGTALYFVPYLNDEQTRALRAGPFRENALPFRWDQIGGAAKKKR